MQCPFTAWGGVSRPGSWSTIPTGYSAGMSGRGIWPYYDALSPSGSGPWNRNINTKKPRTLWRHTGLPSGNRKQSLWSLGARRSAPRKADAQIEDVIAAARIVLNSFEAVEEPFIAITEIEKCAVMHKKLNTSLRPDGPGSITVVPRQSNECAQVGNNDISEAKMPVDEWCRSGDPNIPTIVNEVVV